MEVSDTRTERWPSVPALSTTDTESESGRGLLLVTSLADDWGVTDRLGGPGKTVWASVECPVPPSRTRASHRAGRQRWNSSPTRLRSPPETLRLRLKGRTSRG